MLHDHPIFGVGPDNFLYYYSNDSKCARGHIANWYYRQDNKTNFERCISHPHNMVLDFWLSTGILGLLAALVLLGMFAVLGLRMLRSADAKRRGPLLGAMLAMLALVVHGEVDNSYFLPDLAVYFWLCLGIVTLLYSESRADGSPAGTRNSC
jgi:O-antigen ligase